MSETATVYFDSQLHAALRLQAAHTDRTVSDLVNEAVRAALQAVPGTVNVTQPGSALVQYSG